MAISPGSKGNRAEEPIGRGETKMAKADARVQHRGKRISSQGKEMISKSTSVSRKCAKEIQAAKGGGFLTRDGRWSPRINQSNRIGRKGKAAMARKLLRRARIFPIPSSSSVEKAGCHEREKCVTKSKGVVGKGKILGGELADRLKMEGRGAAGIS
jgi:hypothetical protein